MDIRSNHLSRERVPMTEAIEHELKQLTSRYSYLCPKGWHTIIKMTSKNNQFNYLFDAASDESYNAPFASGQIKTLEQFPKYAYTGDIPISAITADVSTFLKPNHPLMEKISTYATPAEIRHTELEQLCVRHGYVPTLGGIRVPFTIAKRPNSPNKISAEVLIAFDGANEEFCAMMALRILKIFRRAIRNHTHYALVTHNTTALHRSPSLHAWIDLMNLRNDL